ncbi:hypothetical protein [Streptomyces mobaraensis]
MLLTVFRKERMREDVEVKRALIARQRCAAEHPPAHEVYYRQTAEEER